MTINLVGDTTTFSIEFETTTLILMVCAYCVCKFLATKYLTK